MSGHSSVSRGGHSSAPQINVSTLLAERTQPVQSAVETASAHVPRLDSMPCDPSMSTDALSQTASALQHATPAALHEPVPAALPPVDLNKLHSAAMRAQLTGDMAKHARLMSEIAALQAAASALYAFASPKSP